MVTTPSLPTSCMTSAIRAPNSLSSAEMIATWVISSLVVTERDILFRNATTLSFAFSRPRFKAMGSAPAVTFFNPSAITA